MSRRVVGIAVVVLVAVLGIWYLVLWSPTKSDLDKAKQRRTAAESQQSQLQAEIARLKEAQRNEPANRAKLERYRVAIPDDPALGQFIIDVNDAATRSGIDFISIAPSQPKAPARPPVVTTTTEAGGSTTTTTAPSTTGTTALRAVAPAEVGLAMQIQGGYFQILDFLNRLDAMPRLVVVDSLNVGGGENGRLNVTIAARMFVRAVPVGFAGGTATTSTTVAGGSTTTTTAAGGVTTTTAAGGVTTTTAARP